MTDPEVIKTIAWTVLFIFAIQSASIYAIVRLMATGKPMFERQERDGEEPRRVVGIGR